MATTKKLKKFKESYETKRKLESFRTSCLCRKGKKNKGQGKDYKSKNKKKSPFANVFGTNIKNKIKMVVLKESEGLWELAPTWGHMGQKNYKANRKIPK